MSGCGQEDVVRCGGLARSGSFEETVFSLFIARDFLHDFSSSDTNTPTNYSFFVSGLLSDFGEGRLL